ncbi:sensor histidine kinase [Streptacidiphilus fuscans]|uniref:histidine kinase n=1 Tax=Streptacidiphilus fuscans TaxID=2789292 RepID=A0A931FFH3_9ACTN|nr:histidine kinase [Streptacidiphilus fuscans]MBF9070280.1 sensor histidine kinase [Streptacidiphilus fuscans]
MPFLTAVRRAFAPYGRQGLRDIAFLATSVPLALLPVTVLMSGTVTWTLVVVSALVLVVLPWLTQVQRSRFVSLLQLEIPVIPAPRPRWRWLIAETTWRQLLYHVVVNALVAAYALGLLFVWSAGLVLVSVPAWFWAVPSGSTMLLDTYGMSVAVTVGAVALLLVPWLALLGRWADTRAAARLLGPNRVRELARRVEDLAESRAEVVDAADAERRRIERDLHDGAQQRLVSLAMNLGLARRTLKNLPPQEQAVQAMTVIDEAHDEAQAAIAELRDLVRGLHPVVLEDRGLDAALSGIAARAPLPVRLDVRMERRAAPAVEAVAYFVVSEALANIAKHAQASRAEVTVREGALAGAGRRNNEPGLIITVVDDGVGGADPAKGTGLVGLRQRAASVDGNLQITSPLGGPTTLIVELPCAL